MRVGFGRWGRPRRFSSDRPPAGRGNPAVCRRTTLTTAITRPVHRSVRWSADPLHQGSSTCCCACPRCSCEPCAMIRRTPRFQVTGCSWGGYVRRVAPGIFTWLPLGVLVLRNVEEIVRKQMVDAGFQEVHFPRCCLASPMRRLADGTNTGRPCSACRTARMSSTCLARRTRRCSRCRRASTRRTRTCRCRCFRFRRSFAMKPDQGRNLAGPRVRHEGSYSFDYTDEGLELSPISSTATPTSRRSMSLGLSYVICSATSGAMGGSASEEFLAPCESGGGTHLFGALR